MNRIHSNTRRYFSALATSTFYDIVIFTRIKEAVFFTLFFPIFIFVIFNFLWSSTYDDYAFFLLTGVLAMLMASDGLFAVGPTIKGYYNSGYLKYLKKIPIHPSVFFVSLVFSRVLILSVISSFLLIIAILFFNLKIETMSLTRIIMGQFLGLWIFSFLGLFLSFSNLKPNKEGSLINVFYFIILFISEIFYPTKLVNPLLGSIGDIFPLNHLVRLMRGDDFNILPILIWFFLPFLMFLYIFSNSQVKRSV